MAESEWMSRRMLAVSSLNHRQRSGGNLADGHAIPGSGLLPTTWQTPTLGFRKQERQLRTGSTGGCLRSIAQRTHSGACSYWIGCPRWAVERQHHFSDSIITCTSFLSVCHWHNWVIWFWLTCKQDVTANQSVTVMHPQNSYYIQTITLSAPIQLWPGDGKTARCG